MTAPEDHAIDGNVVLFSDLCLLMATTRSLVLTMVMVTMTMMMMVIVMVMTTILTTI